MKAVVMVQDQHCRDHPHKVSRSLEVPLMAVLDHNTVMSKNLIHEYHCGLRDLQKAVYMHHQLCSFAVIINLQLSQAWNVIER